MKDVTATPEDEAHLRRAYREAKDGWCIHPFTAMRFQVLGWTERTNSTGFLVAGAYALTDEGLRVLRAPAGGPTPEAGRTADGSR